MGDWRTQAEAWLSAEQRDDEAADAALAAVFAALDAVEPSHGFVQRTVDAAWRARARRRRLAAVASIAALLLVSVIAGAAYLVLGAASGSVLAAGTAAAAGSTRWMLAAAAAVMDWWSALAYAGSRLAAVVAMPQWTAALAAVELVGAAALYMLHRLLKAEIRFRQPGPLCV